MELDREKARKLGVPVNDVFQTLPSNLGGSYVNDFNRFGRLFRVYVQAEADYRRKPDDIKDLWVRSKTTGDMVPLGTLVTVTPVGGTELTNRFNLLRSVELNGVPAKGLRLRAGDGRPRGGLQGDDAARRWASPTPSSPTRRRSPRRRGPPSSRPSSSSSCSSPRCTRAGVFRGPSSSGLRSSLSGAFFGVWLAGYDNNVYVQIGNIMLIGLAAKNAILIVEFAKAKQDEGMSIEEAALDLGPPPLPPDPDDRLRLHPRRHPAMKAAGAGAGAQNVMGTAVFWGMLVATALGVFLIPGNFAFVETLGRKKEATAADATPPVPAPSHGGGH